MESGLLSEKGLADAAQSFVCIETSECAAMQKRHGVTCQQVWGSGVVFVLTPEGALLHKFVGGTSLETLLQCMREAELKYGLLSEPFVSFYFSMDHPELDDREVEELLEKMDNDLIEVREAAVDRAIKKGAPAYRALRSVDLSGLGAEQGARVKYVLAVLEPYAERVKRHRLDQDVEFLARLLDHPDRDVRIKAQARVQRILPHFEAKSSVELRERWLAEKDRLRWDECRGRYVTD